ncbi:MAG: molecular chaperone HtpG [Candidatus Heimdallarchaeota archaeon]|nr:molecular chaperone HtpG [Candidatus Heimdallarchaeota archaeon]
MASKSEDATSFVFKADTQKLLSIIINSLYQNKEVFIRELISNASDALNKIRIKQLTSEKIFDSDAELVIELISDKEENTLTIRDTGIGMNQKELKTNLGTIAQSGTAEFLDALESNENDLIGQFGVGFYSAFLVSKKVVVKTRSFSQNSKPWTWESEGTEDFQIYPGDKEDRGTEVILHLKDDFGEYNEDYRLKSLVKKYSNYVEFPIKLGEDTLNDQTALWRVSSSEVKDEQYNEFFNHLGSFGEPMVRIHLSADVPIEFYTILYVPRARPRNVVSGDKEWGLKLYNRKILIEEKNKDFLPEYMRFVIGVVDAEDLDLNISREVLQNTRIQTHIKNYLHKKL